MEKAQAEFQEFERKDVRYREELKNCKAKLKKLDDKIAKVGATYCSTVVSAGTALTQRIASLASLAVAGNYI